MPQDFTRKVIAISGAASGIGLATAKHLYSLGATLSITDVRQEGLESAISTIRGHDSASKDVKKGQLQHTKEIENVKVSQDDVGIESGDKRILAVVTDVRSSKAVDSWISQTVAKFGRLDGCANLAGVVGRGIGIKTMLDCTDEDWTFSTSINLTGVFYATRAQIGAFKKLVEDEVISGGSIVNAASTAGIQGNAFNADYSAAKHGVIGLSRSAAKEWGGIGVRVNCVAPGVIDTPMVQTLPQSMQEGIEQHVKNYQALHRRADPLEIAKLIAFLLSDDSSFTTGAVYVADGGEVC